MNKLIKIMLILVCINSDSAFGQSVEEVDTLMQIAQNSKRLSDYTTAKEQLLLLISKERIKDIDLDGFIGVTRLFRDVTLTAQLLELKHHKHELYIDKSCSCGKHKYCHEE